MRITGSSMANAQFMFVLQRSTYGEKIQGSCIHLVLF